jgi:WD40 repeat protein
MKLAEFWNIPAIVYTPDGAYLVGGGISRNARIWRTSDGVDLFTLYHSGQVLDLAMSPDGTSVASGSCGESDDSGNCNQGAVWVWEVQTGKLLQKLEDLPDWVEQVAYSLDGSVLIAGTRDGTLHFYNTADYQLISTIRPPDGNGLFDLSPDGKILATTGRDGTIHLWRHEP